MARPVVAPDAKRTDVAAVKFSPSEMARVKANAKYSGKNRARFIRDAALGACIIEPPKELAS